MVASTLWIEARVLGGARRLAVSADAETTAMPFGSRRGLGATSKG